MTISNEQMIKAFKLHKEDGLTIGQLSVRFNVKSKTLTAMFKRHGLETDPKKQYEINKTLREVENEKNSN